MRTILISVLLLVLPLSCFGEENSKYFVFVGEKISLDRILDTEAMMDLKFLARYRILEPVKGVYNGNEIEFTVFDHYGVPAFSEYQYVLLYVQQYDGKYYHAKYQYNPLYKTKDGKWASPYSTYDYININNRNTPIKPEIIEFEKPVIIDLSKFPSDRIKKQFPEPYYKISGDKAIAVYGNYINELFLLKQGGVLKTRGDFQSSSF